MGILKGIYQYEEDSGSEFKDWATDVPGESFGNILEELRMIFLNLMRDGVPKIEKVFKINCRPANKAVAPDRRSRAV
jgi:hypothetical protein